MWQEIIANKKTDKDEVINYAVQIFLQLRVRYLHVVLQILSKRPDIDELPKDKGT